MTVPWLVRVVPGAILTAVIGVAVAAPLQGDAPAPDYVLRDVGPPSSCGEPPYPSP